MDPLGGHPLLIISQVWNSYHIYSEWKHEKPCSQFFGNCWETENYDVSYLTKSIFNKTNQNFLLDIFCWQCPETFTWKIWDRSELQNFGHIFLISFSETRVKNKTFLLNVFFDLATKKICPKFCCSDPSQIFQVDIFGHCQQKMLSKKFWFVL